MIALASVADIASIVTGLVTIALVAVTYAAVNTAKTSARAASLSAQLAAKQLQEAHRPLLIPLSPRPDGHEVDIPVENIGAGPALRIFARAQVKNQPPGVIGRFPQHVLPGVAANGEVVLRLALSTDELLSIRITYVDSADRGYTTEASWDRRVGRFTHTTVAEGDSARVPVHVHVGKPHGSSTDDQLAAAHDVTPRRWLSLDPACSRPDQALLANWLRRRIRGS
jgi:hypothetical protein